MESVRVACSASGWVVRGIPGEGRRGALLDQRAYDALLPLARERHDFRMEDGSRFLVLEVPAPDHPLPAPASKAQEAAPVEEHILPELPEGFSLLPLRTLLADSDGPEAGAACRAVHLAAFRKRVVFCPRCATRLDRAETGASLICSSCGLEEFPRVSPAVIVLVEWKGRILLARNARFTGGLHSLVAGFTEPGESFEECAARELMEETGVQASDFRYAGSQPWPFPDSIMVGFRAKASNRDIRVDEREIVEADWYGPDSLPPIPRRGSIARRLIDEWLAERGFTAT
jgi:NAD+ diphosphatase